MYKAKRRARGKEMSIPIWEECYLKEQQLGREKLTHLERFIIDYEPWQDAVWRDCLEKVVTEVQSDRDN